MLNILRGENSRVVALSMLASSATPMLARTLYIEMLDHLSLEELESMELDDGPYLINPISNYLKNDILTKKEEEVTEVKRQALKLVIDGDKLLKRCAKTKPRPLLKRVGLAEANYVLIEIHEGDSRQPSGRLNYL